MRSHEDIVGDFPAYALGALDQDAHRAVEDLIERDAEAAGELAEMLDTVAEISARVGEDAPPAALREHVIAAVEAEASDSSLTVAFEESASRRAMDGDIIRDFPAYALNTLDEDAAQAVEDLVDRDPEAADQLARDARHRS